MISLCMIVKMKKNLKSCLEKAALFVDEIVIVDTGSKDRTIDIAKSLQIKYITLAGVMTFQRQEIFQ